MASPMSRSGRSSEAAVVKGVEVVKVIQGNVVAKILDHLDDLDTGEIGVAVQSHWFSVGSLVTWGEAGVGAVATQSFVDPRYGPLGIELMRLGRTAEEALRALVSTDAGGPTRQVA